MNVPNRFSQLPPWMSPAMTPSVRCRRPSAAFRRRTSGEVGIIASMPGSIPGSQRRLTVSSVMRLTIS